MNIRPWMWILLASLVVLVTGTTLYFVLKPTDYGGLSDTRKAEWLAGRWVQSEREFTAEYVFEKNGRFKTTFDAGTPKETWVSGIWYIENGLVRLRVQEIWNNGFKPVGHPDKTFKLQDPKKNSVILTNVDNGNSGAVQRKP